MPGRLQLPQTLMLSLRRWKGRVDTALDLSPMSGTPTPCLATGAAGPAADQVAPKSQAVYAQSPRRFALLLIQGGQRKAGSQGEFNVNGVIGRQPVIASDDLDGSGDLPQ